MTDPGSLAPPRISPGDLRYPWLVGRGFNKRFASTPDYVRLVASTGQVIEALRDALDERRRVAVRSGGHCLEGFVADSAVQVIIDTSPMNAVYYDPAMRAFAAEAGATLGEVWRRLFLGWGVMIPAGESPDIGIGGHVAGGAFGFFCRQHGLLADYLYAVEVVGVDTAGFVRSVVATREAGDPNRDLWWAHTGGGGGNFGIMTRCWFRRPDAEGDDPLLLLPKAPESVAVFRAEWPFGGFDEAAFTRLLRNHGAWCERNSDPGSPFAELFSCLFLHHRLYGNIELKGVATGPDAERLIGEHLVAIGEGVGVAMTQSVDRSAWLDFALHPFPELYRSGLADAKVKVKDALLRKGFTDRQIAVAWKHLTSGDDVPGGMLGVNTYGGKINTVAPDATASAQRSAIMGMSCVIGWIDPAAEPASLAWVRAFYAELFAETGGVPAPGERTDGALINHPDADLADSALNRSGVPWPTLYYKDNYPALQSAKARWDPLNVFRHALSVRSHVVARSEAAKP